MPNQPPIKRLIEVEVPREVYSAPYNGICIFDMSVDESINVLMEAKRKITEAGYINLIIHSRYNDDEIGCVFDASRMQTNEEHDKELKIWNMEQKRLASEKSRKLKNEVKELRRLIKKHGIPSEAH